MSHNRTIFTMLTIAFVILIFSIPSFATEVAVVNVARVIDSSAPGKAGQRYIDDLEKRLNAELEQYMKTVANDKDAEAKITQKRVELNVQFKNEYLRVTNLISSELKKVITQWIKTNKKGITVVLPAHEALGYAGSANISRDIQLRFDSVKINFTPR